ncbi:MAG TPA: hypothetical protein PLO61_09870 [Fimbriimonadaceae bacterium]|nr:hypothetical protein [Fimbriimonadaceae bacterium]HRJ33908.1 hypothetical protein [Fimbriimonadaceae bacterium]
MLYCPEFARPVFRLPVEPFHMNLGSGSVPVLAKTSPYGLYRYVFLMLADWSMVAVTEPSASVR